MRLVVNGKIVEVEKGAKLSDYVFADFQCGGKGKCGKCKVIAKGNLSELTETEKKFLKKEEILNGVRLACETKITGDAEVFTTDAKTTRVLMEGEKVEYELSPIFKNYGLAVDIGTTTVVVGVYSINGERLARTGFLNPQLKWGADVLSRIEASINGKAEDLQSVIVTAIEDATLTLCLKLGINIKEIDGAVFTGNTAMLYLLTNTPVFGLEKMPFFLKRPFGEFISAKDINAKSFSPNMNIYLPPCISPFIGADTVCALLTTSFWNKKQTFVLADVGTNGEIALFKNGRFYACSTAAGPAFEGAGLSCGMRGEEGAIEKVSLQDGKFIIQVIGDKTPKGICGSGVIDALRCLLELNELDESGYMEEDVVLADGVSFTKKDVRAVQLAKGAIYAGIITLLKTVGVTKEEIDFFMLAGGFGGRVNVANAGEIRLIPKEWLNKTKTLGNASFNGAVALLLSKGLKEKSAEIIALTDLVDLSKSSIFMEEYADGMAF